MPAGRARDIERQWPGQYLGPPRREIDLGEAAIGAGGQAIDGAQPGGADIEATAADDHRPEVGAAAAEAIAAVACETGVTDL